MAYMNKMVTLNGLYKNDGQYMAYINMLVTVNGRHKDVGHSKWPT